MDQPLVPEYATLGARLQRRAISVTALFLMAVVVTLSAPMWLVVVVFVDLARFRWTLPLATIALWVVLVDY